MFKVEYLLKCWVKKDGLNANLVLCDWPNLRCPHDFAFSSHCNKRKIINFDL